MFHLIVDIIGSIWHNFSKLKKIKIKIVNAFGVFNKLFAHFLSEDFTFLSYLFGLNGVNMINPPNTFVMRC
jgi:hypothetical protein